MCTYQAQRSQSAQKKWRKALYALPALDWHSHDTAESVFWNTELVAQEDKHYYYFDTGIPVISGMYGKHISTGFYGITYIESRRYSCSTETNLGAWVTRFPGRAQLCSSWSSENKAVPELSHIRHQRDLTNLATEWKLQVSVTMNSRFHCTSHSTEQSTEPQQHCNSSSQIQDWHQELGKAPVPHDSQADLRVTCEGKGQSHWSPILLRTHPTLQLDSSNS